LLNVFEKKEFRSAFGEGLREGKKEEKGRGVKKKKRWEKKTKKKKIKKNFALCPKV
jgi:hypothetical protein